MDGRFDMPKSKGKTINRQCDVCDLEYAASIRRLERGWDRTCSKSCANRIRVIPKRRQVVGPYTRLDSRDKLKETVRALAGGVCQHCGKSTNENGRALDVHRIVPDGLGGKYELDNLVALCRSCHAIADRATLK